MMTEVKKPLLYSYSPHDRDQWPDWYVWTDGWYEANGEQTYYVDWGMLGDGAVVFDVGCYTGKWIGLMNARFPGYEYYGFEPSPVAFETARTQFCGCENVNLYNFGLGAQSGIFKLRDYTRDSATFMPVHEHSDPSYMNKTDAEIVEISQFLESECIQCIDLMAMNIEGMEFELIPHLIKSGIAKRTKFFMLQWHSVIPNAFAEWQEIQTALAETHRMIWNLGAWEAWQVGSVL